MSFRSHPGCTRAGMLAVLVIALGLGQGGCSLMIMQPEGQGAPRADAVPAATTPAVTAARVLSIAREQLDSPYKYGGAGPDNFDCSGLVYYSYLQTGIVLPRTALAQFSYTKPVSVDDLAPGDLVFFRLGSSRVSHVGIYEGGRSFIHASSTGRGVMSNSLDSRYWRERWVRGGRIAAASP